MTQRETLPFKRDPTSTAGLRASLKGPDLRQRHSELQERFDREGDPNLQLEAAFIEHMIHDFDTALASAQAAYRGLRKQARNRRAALPAAPVGRICFEGPKNQTPPRGGV